MSEIRVASRYAKSVLDLAVEQNKLEEVNKDMILFLDFCHQSYDLVKLFRNPVVKADKKLAVVHIIFKERISNFTMLFLELIVRKSREMYMVEIAQQFRHQYNEHKGIVNATVTTAVGIDDSLKQQIRSFIAKQTGKHVELAAEVKPDIIGGLVVRMEDKLFDGSIAGKLAGLRKKLTNVQ